MRFTRTATMMPSHENLHATAIIIGDRSILFRGASGSGKTTLALALMAAAASCGRHAALLADDQVLLAPHDGRLVCVAPATIAGLVEVRGSTPQLLRYEPAAVIDLVVTLVEEAAVPRYSEDRWSEIAGCRLPELVLPSRNVAGAMSALLSRFSLPPFG